MPIIKICKSCNKEFKVTPNRIDTANYCSIKCRFQHFKKGHIPWNKGLHTGIKPWLGKKRSKATIEKIRFKHIGKIGYWFNKVRSEKTKNKISKSRKGKNTKENNPMWKGGQYINNNGYKFILKPNYNSSNKQGYILEHRYIMEQYLKRPLNKFEIVHHINGNRIDNKIANLMLFNKHSHAFYHFPKGSKFGKNQISI